jgi:uncharacterized damage-inducible protein DinB
MKENEMQLIVKMAVDAWQTQNTRVDKLLTTLSDEQLANEIAPGKNTGTYLLGHLIAVNDNLFPLFGFGERSYPHLDDIFLKSPDKSGKVFPSITELKKYWNDVNSKLLQHINKLSPEAWLTRHSSVSEEDFAKEPHRNKLNVLLNRTSHQSYHLGQMMLLK